MTTLATHLQTALPAARRCCPGTLGLDVAREGYAMSHIKADARWLLVVLLGLSVWWSIPILNKWWWGP